jgi:hypothetical protein
MLHSENAISPLVHVNSNRGNGRHFSTIFSVDYTQVTQGVRQCEPALRPRGPRREDESSRFMDMIYKLYINRKIHRSQVKQVQAGYSGHSAGEHIKILQSSRPGRAIRQRVLSEARKQLQPGLI